MSFDCCRFCRFSEKPFPISMPMFIFPCLIWACISSRQFSFSRIIGLKPLRFWKDAFEMSVWSKSQIPTLML